MPKNNKVGIYTKLANKYNLPYNVVEVICNSPFVFANRCIANDDNIKPIMFPYLCKIKLKKKYEKETRNQDATSASE